jgi:hypothetical protein
LVDFPFFFFGCAFLATGSGSFAAAFSVGAGVGVGAAAAAEFEAAAGGGELARAASAGFAEPTCDLETQKTAPPSAPMLATARMA